MTKQLFSQFIKSQNIAKRSTAARCALLAAVFTLQSLSSDQLAGGNLSFFTDKLCSDLRHFEITTSKNVRLMENFGGSNGEMITDATIHMYPRHMY